MTRTEAIQRLWFIAQGVLSGRVTEPPADLTLIFSPSGRLNFTGVQVGKYSLQNLSMSNREKREVCSKLTRMVQG